MTYHLKLQLYYFIIIIIIIIIINLNKETIFIYHVFPGNSSDPSINAPNTDSFL